MIRSEKTIAIIKQNMRWRELFARSGISGRWYNALPPDFTPHNYARAMLEVDFEINGSLYIVTSRNTPLVWALPLFGPWRTPDYTYDRVTYGHYVLLRRIVHDMAANPLSNESARVPLAQKSSVQLQPTGPPQEEDLEC